MKSIKTFSKDKKSFKRCKTCDLDQIDENLLNFDIKFLSLDNKKNQKYFDNLSYQQYLANLNNESSDLYD